MNAVSAQNNADNPIYKHAFKGYLTISENSKTTVLKDTFRQQTTVVKNAAVLPSIGWVKYRKNGQFREISLTQIKVLQEVSETQNKLFNTLDSFGNIIALAGDIPGRGLTTWIAQLGVRIEWNFPIYYREKRNLAGFIGISTDPFLFFEKTKPVLSASFPARTAQLSNTFSLIPRLTYALSNRLFVDLNVPISFTTLNLNYQYVDSPILPKYARETLNFRAHFPSNFWGIRVGLGYKI
jgi:hypothetical protein